MTTMLSLKRMAMHVLLMSVLHIYLSCMCVQSHILSYVEKCQHIYRCALSKCPYVLTWMQRKFNSGRRVGSKASLLTDMIKGLFWLELKSWLGPRLLSIAVRFTSSYACCCSLTPNPLQKKKTLTTTMQGSAIKQSCSETTEILA